jgi:hypothetical protein
MKQLNYHFKSHQTSRTSPITFILATLSFGLSLAIAPSQYAIVIMPLLSLFWIGIVFYQKLAGVTESSPSLEIGTVFASIIALYGIYPLFGYLSNGLSYGVLNEARLFRGGPTPTDIAAIGWMYVAFLLAFALTYVLLRDNSSCRTFNISAPPPNVFFIAVMMYATTRTVLVLMGWYYDLSYNDYRELYLVYQRLPFLGYVEGVSFTLELILLVSLFKSYSRFKWVIYGWCTSETLATIIAKESRTHLFLLLSTAFVVYHYTVKPLKTRTVALTGFIALLVFLLLGSVRSNANVNEYLKNPFSRNSEFESIFANAWDLQSRRDSGTLDNPDLAVYFANFTSVIPQMFLPFEKQNASTWYVTTYFPYHGATGGAFDFGVICESIIGFGWPELILRGVVLGIILATVQRRCMRSKTSYWSFCFYVWVTVQCYLLFRNSTFVLIAPAIYRFFLICFAVKFIVGFRRNMFFVPESAN